MCADLAQLADILPTNVVGSFQNITETVAGVLQRGAMPVILGGDHAITFPVVRGFGGTGPLHVVHFDAHLDYMPFVHGLEYTNAHAFRHIRQMEYVTYAELRGTLIALAEHTDVIGFDLVEVNPMLDVGTGVTSYLAAHTVVEFLAFICDQPGWKGRQARAR